MNGTATCGGCDRKVTGEFPGTAIELRYRFTVEGSRIARLEITA